MTLWNRQQDPSALFTATLRDVSVSADDTPVRGPGLFVAGYGDRDDKLDGERSGRMAGSGELWKAPSRSQREFLPVQLDGPAGQAGRCERVTLDRTVGVESAGLCSVSVDHQESDSVRITAQVVGEQVKVR